MKITPALPAEAEILTEIAFAAKRHWGYPEAWLRQWHTLLTVTPEFIATHETFVARTGGRTLGFAAFIQEDGALRLEHLWVRPAEMGRGIGRALFLHSQRSAYGWGYESFEIESDPHAAGFYARMGATQIRTNTTIFEGEPRTLPVFCCRTFRQSKPR